MRRLAFFIFGVVCLASSFHTAMAATEEGADTLATEDFTFTFAKESMKAGEFTAIGSSDAVLDAHFNQARCLCDEKVQIKVTLSQAGLTKLGSEKVVGTVKFGPECNKEGVECTKLEDFTFTATNGTLTTATTVGNLFAAVAKDKSKACTDTEGSFAFWLFLTKGGVDIDALPRKVVTFDSKAPEQPVINKVLPSDGGAIVKWDEDPAERSLSYQILCSPTSAEPTSPAFTYCPTMPPAFANLKFCSGRISSGADQRKVTDLQNGQEYGIALVSIDGSGNVSPLSADKKVTPAPSLSFHEVYDRSGGQAQEGCQMSPGRAPSHGLGWLCGATMCACMLRRLRRHKAKAVALFIAFLSPSGLAHADTLGVIDPGPQHEIDKLARSERGFNLNLGVGFYRPNVDSEFGGDGPFAQVFGKDSDALWQLRLERLLWQKIGTLSLGLGVGYYRAKGKALLQSNDKERSEDETSLHVLPVTLDVGYQYDMGVRRGWGFMPFARAGLDRAFWFMRDEDSTEAHGGTNGWHAAIGLAFALDALDPESGQQLDSETGVNHTLVYAEYLVQDLSGLGRSNRLQLSDSMLSIGFSLQM